MSKLVLNLPDQIAEVAIMVAFRAVDSQGVSHFDTLNFRSSSIVPGDVLTFTPDEPDYLKV